jgi:ABC-type glycerol-3-phosphate transport system permease component
MTRGSPASRLWHVARHGIALLVFLIFAVPYAWIVLSSFKTKLGIFNDASPLSIWTLIPRMPIVDNFVRLFTERGIGQNLVNSSIVAAGQVVFTVVVSSATGFALSILRFRGQSALFGIILISMMIPFQAVVVPLFEVVRRLGVTDSLVAVFLPWISSGLAIFIMRQAFYSIPRDMMDAAVVDGASDWRVFRSVCLPLVGPAIATVVLVTFVDAWNAFLWPLIVLSSPSNQVIQVAIANAAPPGLTPEWGLIFAGATVATLPTLAVFLALQRYFIQGFALTGTKG